MKLERKKDSPKIGIEEWHLPAFYELHEVIDRAIAQAIEVAFREQYAPHIELDLNYAEPDDPTSITVALPFGENEDDHPEWSTSVTEIVKDFIDGERLIDGKISFDDRSLPKAKRLRDGLNKLVDTLDKAIKES